MKHAHITSLGHYVPKTVLTNKDLAEVVDTTDEWIRTRTGIGQRYIAKNEKTSEMALAAAREALAGTSIKPEDVELIIVATISPDSSFPAMACLVQKELGAMRAAAFDVSAACSGFLFALTTAKQYLTTGMYKNAVVIAAERISSLVDWKDRGTCVLFGDGAGAAVLEASDDATRGVMSDYMLSYGDQSQLLYVEAEQARTPFNADQHDAVKLPYIIMQGRELFKIAVNAMAQGVETALERAGLTADDVDLIVPHQANDRIITAVADKLKFPKEKVFVNIEKYGNMSAASIAVALYEAKAQGHIKEGSVVVLVTFGAGLVAAANVVKF